MGPAGSVYYISILEIGAIVWSSGVSIPQSVSIERVQKRALRIIAYPRLLSYSELMRNFNIQELTVI